MTTTVSINAERHTAEFVFGMDRWMWDVFWWSARVNCKWCDGVCVHAFAEFDGT